MTAGDALAHLVTELGFDFTSVAKLEISLMHIDGAARIRVLQVDRALHSRRIEIPAKEEVPDERS
ncbi:hypothetical protein [Streptomyces sp. AC495_CC817]|uniref:hypothetical protein n=1 Tax=Streptomyces sp. AC495_CC817 TaxID=2823900 RepID=UPI001C25FAE8|nr:hypothetical protein [Streptomyces sp. AC495_CC817]